MLVKSLKMNSKMPGNDSKHCFLDLTQLAFWDGKETENEFKVTCLPLKHPFLELTQVAFGLLKIKKMCSQCLATTWNIVSSTSTKTHFGWSRGWKWVLSASTTWKNDLSTSINSHFGLAKRKKMISKCHGSAWNIVLSTSSKSNLKLVKRQKMTFKCHSTTWIVQLLGWLRGWKWVRSAWRPLETSLYQPHLSRIWAGQEEENDFKDSWKHLNHRFIDFIQVEFWSFKEAENDKCHSTTWIVALYTWKNRIFGTVKKQKMTSKFHSTHE